MSVPVTYVGADRVSQVEQNATFGELHIEFTPMDAECHLSDVDAARIKSKVVTFMKVEAKNHIQGEEVNTTTLAEAAADEFGLSFQAPRRGDYMSPEQLSDWAFEVAEKIEPFLRHDPLEVLDDTGEDIDTDGEE